MNAEWSVHVSEKNESLISLRLNESIKEYICHPQYSYFLSISIILKQAAEIGFPENEERIVLTELEELIVEQLVDNMLCVLAAVVTAEGSRKYIMYTYAPEQCEKIFSILNETWMHHDIQFSLQEDPEWSVFESLLS